jgi:hypothetical protein
VEVVAALALAPAVVEAAVVAALALARAVVVEEAAVAVLALVLDPQRLDKPDRRKAMRR